MGQALAADLPAFIALAYAYSGVAEEAAVYRRIFLDTFQEKVTKGRPPEAGEAMEWMLTANPFQREEDSKFYREGLLKAGFIIAIFMHMWWEKVALIYAILMPPLCILVLIALMHFEGDYTSVLREAFFVPEAFQSTAHH